MEVILKKEWNQQTQRWGNETKEERWSHGDDYCSMEDC